MSSSTSRTVNRKSRSDTISFGLSSKEIPKKKILGGSPRDDLSADADEVAILDQSVVVRARDSSLQNKLTGTLVLRSRSTSCKESRWIVERRHLERIGSKPVVPKRR